FGLHALGHVQPAQAIADLSWLRIPYGVVALPDAFSDVAGFSRLQSRSVGGSMYPQVQVDVRHYWKVNHKCSRNAIGYTLRPLEGDKMANERTYPLLPCRELDESIGFYEVLGFKRTYRQL